MTGQKSDFVPSIRLVCRLKKLHLHQEKTRLNLIGARVKESIGEIQQLLHEIVAHLKSGTKPGSRQAASKLKRIADLASTSALMLQAQR